MAKLKQMMTHASWSVAKENTVLSTATGEHKLVLVLSMAVPREAGNHLPQIQFYPSWLYAQRTIHFTTDILVHPC